MKVPDTGSFSLQDVYNSVNSHVGGVSGNLQSCFDYSLSYFFDPNYGAKTMSPKPMYGFRNYTPRPIIITNDPTSVTKKSFYANADFVTIGDSLLTPEVGVEIRYEDDSNGGNLYSESNVTGIHPLYFFYIPSNAANLIQMKPLTAYKYRALLLLRDFINPPIYYYGDWVHFTSATGTPNIGTWGYANTNYLIDAFVQNVYVGGAPALTRVGICYSITNSTPTVADSVIDLLVQEGGQFHRFFGLNQNTTYYIRAFAQNSLGIDYGQVMAITTHS